MVPFKERNKSTSSFAWSRPSVSRSVSPLCRRKAWIPGSGQNRMHLTARNWILQNGLLTAPDHGITCAVRYTHRRSCRKCHFTHKVERPLTRAPAIKAEENTGKAQRLVTVWGLHKVTWGHREGGIETKAEATEPNACGILSLKSSTLKWNTAHFLKIPPKR